RERVGRRGREVNCSAATDRKARISEQYDGHTCAGDGSAINVDRCVVEKVCSWGKSHIVSGRHRQVSVRWPSTVRGHRITLGGASRDQRGARYCRLWLCIAGYTVER